jgi:hypothetical protein
MSNFLFTSYDDVNAILNEVLTGAQVILGDNFVGMYLDGSLASGDFNYETSDIDFVVATAREVSATQMAALVEMHGRIGKTDSKWAIQLEGAYIPLAALRRYDTHNATHPYIDRGASNLRWEHLDMDWVIHRHVLNTWGVTLAGPPSRSLIDPVTPDELRQATADLLAHWWAPMLDDPTHLEHDGSRAYAVMTMCRALYTWRHGDVVSKPAAGRWALAHLDERWAALIERAMSWQNGRPMGDVPETQAFIRFTYEYSRGL